MMFDDEAPKKAKTEFPRNLEPLSIDDIKAYIVDLKGEISRAENDIIQKEASRNAADSFFKL